MSSLVRFELNGENVESSSRLDVTLAEALRDEFGMTGVKAGCGEGECGACTVLLDGKPALSCVMALGAVNGRQVTTIEGLRETPGFAILSQAFADAGAVQCGFCTPGMILVAYAYLNGTETADEAGIRAAMSGNLCRCTGYETIVDAVLLADAEKKRQGRW